MKKYILVAVLSILFVVSLGFNVYMIHRSLTTKSEIKDVVDTNITPIVTTVTKKNDDLNKKADETIKKIQTDFEKSPVVVKPTEEQKADPKLEYVTVTIRDKSYDMLLSNDIYTSHQQIKLLAEKLNEVEKAYETELKDRNDMISDLTSQLNTAKQNITDQVNTIVANRELAQKRDDFFKFGIDVFANFGVPINDYVTQKKITGVTNYDIGVGFNFMFVKTINIRLATGMEYESNTYAPKIGIGIGYFFK